MFKKKKVILKSINSFLHNEKVESFFYSILPTIFVFGFMFNLALFTFFDFPISIFGVLSLGFLWVFISTEIVSFINRVK